MFARRLAALSLLVAIAASSRAALADVRPHAKLGAAHAVGRPQGSEFGLGGAGGLGLELMATDWLGLQASVGGAVLSKGDPPADPRLARQSVGTLFSATGGARLHPFGGKSGGLWVDANAGLAQTGNLSRLGLEGDIGWDFRLRSSRVELGPYLGYFHILQPATGLRGDDARVVSLGLHVGFGKAEGPKERGDRDKDTIFDDEDACPDVPGVRTSDPRTNGCPRGDRDKDTIFDDEDACPEEPGVRTSDPKTNGCPRRDRDKDGIFDDEDACPDEPGIRTDDPKTNGCADRDNDAIPDGVDACPDVPGQKTDDPTTNGCPPEDRGVRLAGDRFELDDVIHFDLDSPRVRHSSWALVQRVADFISQNPDILEVSIEGHADATGTDEHNEYLSKERAESVRKLLIKYGVAAYRLKAEAHGRSKLKVQTTHAELQNRRVEFWVTRSRAAQTRGKSKDDAVLLEPNKLPPSGAGADAPKGDGPAPADGDEKAKPDPKAGEKKDGGDGTKPKSDRSMELK